MTPLEWTIEIVLVTAAIMSVIAATIELGICNLRLNKNDLRLFNKYKLKRI